MNSELENYLHTHIPISKALGVKVENASAEKVILSAPFEKNINHKKTVFGGSLHAVATLACWGWLHIHLKNLGPLDIVITSSQVEYLAPVISDFQVQCQMPQEHDWKTFVNTLKSKGRARIQLKAEIFQNNKLSVAFTGTFAALNLRIRTTKAGA